MGIGSMTDILHAGMIRQPKRVVGLLFRFLTWFRIKQLLRLSQHKFGLFFFFLKMISSRTYILQDHLSNY